MSANQNSRDRFELDALKARVDLVAVVRETLDLKKTGKNWLGRCPFHEDATASLSVNPETLLWNCFGCEAGGDVLEWLKRKENLSFPESVKRLETLAGVLPKPESNGKPKKDEPLPAGLSRSHIFQQVLEHYRKRFRECPEAQAYLTGRGLGSREVWESFRVGYADGTLLSILPQTGPIREALLQIGLLNAKGREHFRGCLVFPLDHPDLETVSFYGRRIAADSEVKHLYLPGPKRGVLNWQAIKLSPKVWVAESVLDAVSLWAAGVRDVTCLYGAASLPQDLEALLGRYGTREVVFCLDGDRAGREAVARFGVTLTAMKVRCLEAKMPEGQDPNQVLVQEGPQLLKSRATSTVPLDLAPPAPETEKYQRTADGFALEFGEVRYKVTPQPPFGSRLRVTLRASRGSRIYFDTIDLYSNRYRTAAAVQLVRRLSLSRPDAELHLMGVLERAEEWAGEAMADSKKADKGDEEDAVVEMTAAEHEEALEFLESPNLIRRILDDTEALGYVGEENGKLLTYLIGLSRKLQKPLSGIVRSQSGAGKSTLTEMVQQLTPPEDVREYSRLSAQALSFMPKDHLRRKLLIIEERAGSEAADYQIRTLQTRHRLSQAVVIKDPVTGKLSTRFFEVLGPIAYLETTTNPQLNPENASRCFEICLDESEDQTVRIQRCQRQLRESRPYDRQLLIEDIKRRHHNAQRLLEQVIVYVPYAMHLKFPSRWLRTRRDNERFLCLIEVITFLHQHQRERGKTREGTPYILATVEDYRLAFTLAQDVLLNSLHELTREGQELLESIRCWLEDRADPYSVLFTRKELRQYTNLQDYRLRASLNELVDMEYVSVASGSNGKAFHYRLLDTDFSGPSPLRSLTTPDELEAILREETATAAPPVPELALV